MSNMNFNCDVCGRWENSEWEGDIYDKSDVSNAYFDIEANVDNQIEELKKDMK